MSMLRVLSLILASLSLCFFSSGCATPHQNIIPYNGLKTHWVPLQTIDSGIRTRGKILIDYNDLNFSTRFTLVFKYPKQLRMELYPPGGFPVLMIAVHGDTTLMMDLQNRLYWKGSTSMAFKKILPNGFTVNHLMALIVGRAPFDTPPSTLHQQNGWILTWNKGGSEYKALLDAISYKPIKWSKTTKDKTKWYFDIHYEDKTQFPSMLVAYSGSSSKAILKMEHLITEKWPITHPEIFEPTPPCHFKRKMFF